MTTFSDSTIEKLFGAEDAENERKERFREYFYYNKAFENIMSELPIRILVGHKGIGKSALLRRAFLQNEDDKELAVWIRPNDLVPRVEHKPPSDFNQLIEYWKNGLINTIYKKSEELLFSSPFESQNNEIIRNTGILFTSLMKKITENRDTIQGTLSESIAKKFTDNKIIYIYIDDIDRGWAASRENITNISALLNAIRDIAGSDERIKIRIGLRSDVYYLVRTADESTDKLERHVVWLNWTNHDILCIIAKRIATFFEQNYKEDNIRKMEQKNISDEILSQVIVSRFEGRGHWGNRPIHNVLLSLTRKRPRDLIKLMYGAARKAHDNNNEKITSQDLEKSFEPYSHERLQDIINEFRSEVPKIENLLLEMRPTKRKRRTSESFLYTMDSLVTKMREIISHQSIYFTDNKAVTPKSLIQFLYKIDFITARMDKNGEIVRAYFDQSRFLANEIVDFGYMWEVHPAYRWALQPQDINDVFNSIEL